MTTKREEWTLNEASGEIKDEVGNIVADVTRARIGRRIAAVPDYEAALVRLLGAGVCSNTGSIVRGCVEAEFSPCAACEARAALRKGGLL